MTSPTAYRPGTVAAAFARIRRGEDPHVAVGDFLDDWRRTPRSERPLLVKQPIGRPGSSLELRRWAAFLAAAVDQLCAVDGVRAPAWVSRPEYRLAEPWFLIPGWPIRAWLLVSTPVPFKMRNIFGGDSMLDRA